jgi:ribosome-associated toxin RatA of RatAB toxin-antitoxin module
MSTTVRAAAPIEIPIESAWSLLRDLTRATNYVPGLTNTVLTTEKKEGVGASRVVSHKQFGDMNETVVEWNEGRGFTVRLHKGDRPATPFKEAAFRYALEPSRDGRVDACEIHTALVYELPFGVLGRALDSLLLGRTFRQNVIDTAVCLAEHYRTGQPVPADRIKALRKNALPPA